MIKNYAKSLATALKGGKITVDASASKHALSFEDNSIAEGEATASKLLEVVKASFVAENAVSATDSVDDVAFREAMLQGARVGATLATDAAAVVSGMRREITVENKRAEMGSDVVTYTDSERVLATESFDGQSLGSVVYFSSAVTTTLGAQDEFARTFFPPILITGNTSSASVESRIVKLMKTFNRNDINSDADKRQAVLLTDALKDTKVLESKSHRIVPVKRSGTETVLCDIPFDVQKEDETIASAPYKFGAVIPLSFTSKTNTDLTNGTDDETFALVSKINLDAVYYQIGAESFKIDTGIMPFSNFVYNHTQGDSKDMSLSFKSKRVNIKIGTALTYDNKESVELASIADANGYTVSMEIAVHGDISTRDADSEIYGSKFKVIRVRDENGDVVTSGTVYDDIMAKFAGAELVGYDLEAYTSNSNLAQKGQYITADVQSYVYHVPVLSPIIIQKQIANPGIDGDTAYLTDVITTIGAVTSALAVTTITNFSDRMRIAVENAGGNEVEFSGAGRDYVGQRFTNMDVDMVDVVDSLRSADRTEDIQAALVNIIRLEVAAMATSTGYASILRLPSHSGAGANITVAIGTDPQIASYLTAQPIDLGTGFNAKVVSSPYAEMEGKIIFTFIVEDSSRYTKPNPLNFGQMFIAPEIVADIPKQKASGGVVRQIITNPVALCEINLPILTTIEVSGLSEVLRKVSVKTVTA